MTKSIVCMQPLSSAQQELIRAAAPEYTLTLGDSRNPDLELLSGAEIIIGWGKGIRDTVLRQGLAAPLGTSLVRRSREASAGCPEGTRNSADERQRRACGTDYCCHPQLHADVHAEYAHSHP